MPRLHPPSPCPRRTGAASLRGGVIKQSNHIRTSQHSILPDRKREYNCGKKECDCRRGITDLLTKELEMDRAPRGNNYEPEHRHEDKRQPNEHQGTCAPTGSESKKAQSNEDA